MSYILWISIVVVLIVVPGVAVYAAARFLKPGVEKDPGPINKAILIFGLPFTLVMAVSSILIGATDQQADESNTVELEARISDFYSQDWINFETPDYDLTLQIISSFSPVFTYDRLVSDHDPERWYTFTVDRDMYRLATEQVTMEEIGFLDRFELVIFRFANERDLVWVYDLRSEGETYLDLDDANRVRKRQKQLVVFLAAPIFFVGFVFDVLIVAGLLKKPSGDL